MKEYKKLDLKNDNGATNLVHYLNEGWDIFRELGGGEILFVIGNMIEFWPDSFRVTCLQ